MEISSDQMVSFANVAEMAQYVTEQKTRMEVEKVDWKRILKEKVSLQLPKSWFTGRLFVKMTKPFLHMYFGLKAKGLDQIPNGPVLSSEPQILDGSFNGIFEMEHIKNTILLRQRADIKRPFFKALAIDTM